MGLTMLFGLFLCVFLTQDLVGANDSQDSDFELSSHTTRSGKSSKFILYNRQIMANPETVEATPGRPGLFKKLKKNKPVKVVIHGWMGSDDIRFCVMSREVLLKKEDVNVIVVDWSETGSKNMLYPMARQKVSEVAKVLSEFLDNLHQRLGVRLENVHIVGHSLGAHIAGLTGRMVKRGKIGRITGLDPAGPLFRDDKPDERLSTSSALFVDVIHTCGNFLAMHKPIGHADFYPNSGYFIQPGCGVDVSGACSHGRSYYFYLESVVNRRAFPAVTCPSWNAFKDNKNSCDLRHVVYLGEGLSRSARGSYFLRTNDKAPYGLGVL